MSESWKGESKGMTWGYQIFVLILRNFGVLSAYFLLRFVAFYYFIFSFKTTKPLYSYFHERLGFSGFKSILNIYKSYYLIGQSIIDKIVMMSGIPNPFTFNFDGEENLQKMVDLKRGGLLISGHIGNWEIAGHLLKRLETTINIVLYDGEREQIKAYLDGITGKRNVKMIVIKNDLSHIYAISDALANNELVCMLADRFLEGNKTLTADFLGAKAHFPMGPFVLAAKFKVPISYVFAVKESATHYHLFGSEIKEYGHLKKDVIMQTMLNDFIVQLENKIKNYPEQWFNYYDFWKV